jgi:hypothetical protein
MLHSTQPIPRDKPMPYEIQVQGRLDQKWFTVFGGLTVRSERLGGGVTVTILTGMVADQAALHGMLNHIRDLGLPLLLVRLLEEAKP